MTAAPKGFVSGSFRGVPFLTRDHSQSGGRRGQLHEFPQRDTPWFEDLGRKARVRTINLLVLGNDYFAARDALIAAFERKGPGVLIHPFLGQMDVVAEDYDLNESTAQGGLAEFSVTFAEQGAKTAGDVTTDTSEHAQAVADTQSDAAVARFGRKFSVNGLPGYAIDGAIARIDQLTSSALSAGRFLGGAGKVLRTFEAGLSVLDGALDLIETPFRLAESLRAIVRSVGGLGARPILRLRALRAMFDDGQRGRPVIGMTAVRISERANADAFQHLVSAVIAAEAVAVATQVSFASRPEAIAFRDSFADQLDAVAHGFADAGEDEAAAALDALRLAMVRDVTARGSTLEPLTTLTPFETAPALVLAFGLYGHRDLEARTAELVARNRISHPGFVPGGVPLQVLSGGAAGGR